jgi:hypothetical protein
MDKGKIAGGILSLTLVGLAIGYVVATGYLTIRYGLSTQAFDVTLLAREYRALGISAPRDFLWVNLILAGFGVAALLLSVTLLGEALTRFGTTHWQTKAEMKRVLDDIQTGKFTRDWMLENKVHQTSFKAIRARNNAHQIEEVGARLRAMMPWIGKNKLVDKARN